VIVGATRRHTFGYFNTHLCLIACVRTRTHNPKDCDMPENLKVPFAHDDPGIEDVDVMSFLQLKRATPIKKPMDESKEVAP